MRRCAGVGGQARDPGLNQGWSQLSWFCFVLGYVWFPPIGFPKNVSPPSLKLSLQSLPSITNFGPNRVVFILGGTMNTSLQRQVEDEASQFGDIVQVNDIADIVNCPGCRKNQNLNLVRKKIQPRRTSLTPIGTCPTRTSLA